MHCESNGCRSGRKPCPTPRQCGAYSYADGGNYHPEFAENSYSHVHAPAPVAVVKQHIAPETEPMSDFAKAIVKSACISFVIAVLACGAVAVFYP